jgi:uncharacterized membrane protein
MKNYTVNVDTEKDLRDLHSILDDLGLDVEIEFDKISGDVVEVTLGLVKGDPFTYVSFQAEGV